MTGGGAACCLAAAYGVVVLEEFVGSMPGGGDMKPFVTGLLGGYPLL